MIITQAELNKLTRKRYGSRQALKAWFSDVDAILALDVIEEDKK